MREMEVSQAWKQSKEAKRREIKGRIYRRDKKKENKNSLRFRQEVETCQPDEREFKTLRIFAV